MHTDWKYNGNVSSNRSTAVPSLTPEIFSPYLPYILANYVDCNTLNFDSNSCTNVRTVKVYCRNEDRTGNSDLSVIGPTVLRRLIVCIIIRESALRLSFSIGCDLLHYGNKKIGVLTYLICSGPPLSTCYVCRYSIGFIKQEGF